jgi:hypothetical protein
MAGWGVAFADLDNDGWKDLALARSGALSKRVEPVSWLRNAGGQKFTSGGDLIRGAEMHRGLVAADLDDDGCLDIVVSALNAPAKILRNPCRGMGNWVKVAGAKGRVRAGAGWREASTAVGYGSSYLGPLHFGLGAASEVEVEAGGVLKRVKANQVVRW